MTPLEQRARIREHPFRSSVPLVGGLIARLRSAWNNVAARWYVQALFQQQISFNQLAARQIDGQDQRLAAQDTDLTALTRRVAELEIQVRQLAARVAELESDRPTP